MSSEKIPKKRSVACLTDKVDKTVKIEVADASVLPHLFGSQDKHLMMLEDAMQVTITSRGMKIEISGEEAAVDKARSLLKQLLELLARGIPISQTDIVTAIKMPMPSKACFTEAKKFGFFPIFPIFSLLVSFKSISIQYLFLKTEHFLFVFFRHVIITIQMQETMQSKEA